jgi:hypothetical protein
MPDVNAKAFERPSKAAKVSPKAVWDDFQGKIGRDDSDPGEWLRIDEIREGLGRVRCGLENAEYDDCHGNGGKGSLLGPRMFGDVAGIGCFCGGDWEYPIFFVVYLDADGKTLRSYVPKNGNTWNYDLGSAFGNDEEEDARFLSKWLARVGKTIGKNDRKSGEERWSLMFDERKIKQDIAAHVLVVERKNARRR